MYSEKSLSENAVSSKVIRTGYSSFLLLSGGGEPLLISGGDIL